MCIRDSDHHVRHLHIGHVGGQPGDQAGHGELVDVFEGVPLNFVEHILAKVTCKTTAGCGAGRTGQCAESQRQRGHCQQSNSIADNDLNTAPRLYLIDEIGSDKRLSLIHI